MFRLCGGMKHLRHSGAFTFVIAWCFKWLQPHKTACEFSLSGSLCNLYYVQLKTLWLYANLRSDIIRTAKFDFLLLKCDQWKRSHGPCSWYSVFWEYARVIRSFSVCPLHHWGINIAGGRRACWGAARNLPRPLWLTASFSFSVSDVYLFY